MRRHLVLTGLTFLVACQFACTTTRLKPACVDKSVSDPQLREPKADYWITTLLRGPDRDCRGEPIEWKSQDEKCKVSDELGKPLPPPGSIGVENVTIERPDRHERLVWVVTRRHTNGEGEGPIALAELEEEQIRINCLGTLRAMGGATTLELVKLGEKGEVLAAQGKHCPAGGDEIDCVSAVRFLVRRGTYFVPVPMRDPTGACAGPARLFISRARTKNIREGYKLTQELTTSWRVQDGELIVTESLVVYQFDPKRPDSTKQVLKTAEEIRNIRWSAGYLIVDKPPLWESLQDDGTI